ncbi:MAG TPA: hypothetical protein VEU29_06170 [Actinomycetota bacterium]|nr:hypothetical protein [Actinomycetota bacterium]
MEAGEWIAMGVSLSATLAIEVMRVRRGKRERAAAARRREEDQDREDALQKGQSLLRLDVALNGLYLTALEHLRPGTDGNYATASLLKARLVDAGKEAEHAPGDAGAMSAYFVKRCGEIVGWIDRGAAENEKDLLRRNVQEAFESAVRAVAALGAELREGADPSLRPRDR